MNRIIRKKITPHCPNSGACEGLVVGADDELELEEKRLEVELVCIVVEVVCTLDVLLLLVWVETDEGTHS